MITIDLEDAIETGVTLVITGQDDRNNPVTIESYACVVSPDNSAYAMVSKNGIPVAKGRTFSEALNALDERVIVQGRWVGWYNEVAMTARIDKTLDSWWSSVL